MTLWLLSQIPQTGKRRGSGNGNGNCTITPPHHLYHNRESIRTPKSSQSTNTIFALHVVEDPLNFNCFKEQAGQYDRL